MKAYLALLEKELKIVFSSPIAYVFIGLFLTIAGFFFYNIMAWFDRISMQSMAYAQMYRMPPQPINVNMMALRPFFHNLTIIALFLLPGFTMRLFAEEKRQGTLELLETSPITNWQLTLAKFTAAWILWGITLALTGILVGMLFFFGNPEVGQILSGYFGMFLVGGAFIAIGMWFSTMTENQIVAFISALGANLVLLSLGWLSNFAGETLGKLFANIDPIAHFDDFAKGVIDTKHIVFYASFIFMGIFLSFMSVESARWRGSR